MESPDCDMPSPPITSRCQLAIDCGAHWRLPMPPMMSSLPSIAHKPSRLFQLLASIPTPAVRTICFVLCSTILVSSDSPPFFAVGMAAFRHFTLVSSLFFVLEYYLALDYCTVGFFPPRLSRVSRTKDVLYKQQLLTSVSNTCHQSHPIVGAEITAAPVVTIRIIAVWQQDHIHTRTHTPFAI